MNALISFQADEPVVATVRYGFACGALTGVRASSGRSTSHGVLLSGLLPNTTYYYHVEATDAAGNVSIDDNNGSCYSFSTSSGTFALDFDGNDFCQADPNAALDLTTNGALTLEAWALRRPAGGYWQILLTKDNTDPYGLTVSADGFLHFELTTSSGYKSLNTPAGSIPFDTWTHLAATWDGSMMRCYVNGILRASVSHGGTLTANTEPFLVGSGSPTGHENWNGTIDEIRIWNVTRSSGEILSASTVALTGYEPGLVALWRLDEGSGQWAYDSTGNGIRLRLGSSASGDGADPAWVASPIFLRTPAAHIEPLVPLTTDDLWCVLEFTSPLSELLAREYQWFRNGERIDSPLLIGDDIYFATGAILSHHFTAKNETFFCIATVGNDSLPLQIRTDPVEIIDSSPTAPVVSIKPQNPHSSDTLSAEIVRPASDPDGDALGHNVEWLRSADGGDTFYLISLLSGSWTVSHSYLFDGDLWQVRVTPYELGNPQMAGETAWDQVYIGENRCPMVTLSRPAENETAFPTVVIQWEADDADGDALTVDLYYDTDDIEGGAVPIAMDQPGSGWMKWQPPGASEAMTSADLSGDGMVTAEDLFVLASEWQTETKGTRYRIFARAWDERGAIGEAFSPGEVIVPEGIPANTQGLLRLLSAWGRR